MSRRLPAIVALLLLAVVPFLGGIDGPFIEDDVPIIRDNPALRADGRLWSVFGQNYWYTRGQGGVYRPLTVWSYGVDRLLWGEDMESGAPAASGIHRSNVGLHAGITLLVYHLLAGRLPAWGGAVPGGMAWLGAALFAVHPVHTEAVIHLVGRADLLVTLFFVAAVILHGRPGAPSRVGAASCYLGALLSKEMGVFLPALFLIDAWLHRRGRGWAFIRDETWRLWPYAFVLASFVILRGVVLGARLDPPQAFVLYVPAQYVAFPDPRGWEIPLTMVHAFGEYCLLLLAPFWLGADYSGFPHHLTPALPVVLSAAAGITLTIACVRALRHGHPEPTYWFAWFLLTLLPVSNLLAISGIVMAERVLYLPSVAACACGGWVLATVAQRRRALVVVPIGVLVGFAALAGRRTLVWNDPVRLYEETVRRGRFHGHIALTGLAGEYVRMIRRDPDHTAALLAPALDAARRSVAASQNTLNLGYLAFLLERSGDLAGGLENWEHLRRSFPGDPRYRAEVRRLLQAIRIRPASPAELDRTVAICRVSLGLARRFGDRDGFRLWTEELAPLFDVWVPGAGLHRPDRRPALLRALEVAHAGVEGMPGAEAGPEREVWSVQRERLLRIWIDGAVAGGDWPAAVEAWETIARVDPDSPLLARHAQALLQHAIPMLHARGEGPRADRLTTALGR